MNIIEAAKAMEGGMIVKDENGVCCRFDPITSSGQIVIVSNADEKPIPVKECETNSRGEEGYRYYPAYLYLDDLLSDKWEVVGRVGDPELVNTFGRLAK